MLAKILAVLVGLSSVSFYGLAWTFPQLSRRYDVVWAGAGLFYALVLWVCSGQVTGAIALGQLVIIGLLGALAWQVLQLRSGTPGESPALAQGMGAIALAGAVRSRVTGLSLFKRESIEETAKPNAPAEVKPEPKPATEETKEAQPAKAEKKSTVKAADKQVAEDKTESKPQKKAPPKAATKPMPTGKGVYQRKKVRKFDQPTQSPGKATGQPVYQRKKVRKFDETAVEPAQPTPEKVAAKADIQPKTAPPEQSPKKQAIPTSKAPVAVVVVDIDQNFWEMAAIAPDALLIPDNAATSTLPALDDPWTTPEVDPESLQLGDVEAKTPKEATPEPARKPTSEKRSPRRRKPAPMPQDSNWPDDGDSNWPDDNADSNWPDEQPARRPPKNRRKPRPSVPVVEAEVVERSPRRPIILDAELVQDDEP